MGVSHGEFLRLLPLALGGASFTERPPRNGAARRLVAASPAGEVTISLAPEAARKIAAMELPVTEVTLEFRGFTEERRRAFLQRFDLAFHRAGG